ncbi:eEF1A lysine and N-terminal methyltransferase homolog [Ischnura elegans]|uniref:eEF1A lysine and N-terminal methyltransferase homolog n=1 Tax=Ischnura elegans TaxID=197161 RepID=UPI001ED8AF4E|nr:eEF1A lysine and N-terminal methyltransferase homolog [Ischnura elegans]
MNLLPQSHEEFRDKEYWDSFFKKRGSKAFEWYGEYAELSNILHKYIKLKDEILVIGCGNSTLSADLYDVGFKKITNIDVSEVAIKKMSEVNKEIRPEMTFQKMDATDTKFANDKFSCVLDKGTLDAMMPDDGEESQKQILKLFNEIGRLLRVGGRYVVVSLLQSHILNIILNHFPKIGWMLRVVHCVDATDANQITEGSSGGSRLPVFVVICTKMLGMIGKQAVIEFSVDGESVQRLTCEEELIQSIQQVRKGALALHRVASGEEGAALDLYRPGQDTPRYTVHLANAFSRATGSPTFAAFLVPQGRETDWLFGSVEGRQQLAKSAGVSRLAVVSLHRGQEYPGGLETIRKEISPCVRRLAPHALRESKIPILSVAPDDAGAVGQRQVIHNGKSEITGEFVVEEVETSRESINGPKFVRRLIFMQNPRVVQSETWLKTVKSRKGNPKKVVDNEHLSCEHHYYMLIGVSAVLSEASLVPSEANKVLVVGLGGGGLCMYMQQLFKKASITAVEIDPAILDVATKYFGLTLNDQLKVHIGDGVEYVVNAAKEGTEYSAILFDVDSKDIQKGMSCPPQQFLTKDTLKAVQACLQNTGGIFVLNLVCRSSSLRKEVLNLLESIFGTAVCSYKLDEEVNEIFYCSSISMEGEMWREVVDEGAKALYGNLHNKKSPVIDLNEFSNGLISAHYEVL